MGMSASIGGGVLGFTDASTNNNIDVGGGWEARLGVGTRSIVGVEAAYTGSASNINALGLDNSAILVSNGLEGDVRLNLAGYFAVTPYVFGGVGWRRYDLTNADFNTSDVNDQDDVMEIPVGAGIEYRYRGFLFDARGTFRPAFNDDLLGPGRELHTWAATGRLGFEF